MATRALSIEDANLRSTSTVTTTQNKEYSDLDISLAVKDTTGDVYKKLSAESVKFAVKNLLLTNQGEKPFNPYYGGNLYNFGESPGRCAVRFPVRFLGFHD